MASTTRDVPHDSGTVSQQTAAGDIDRDSDPASISRANTSPYHPRHTERSRTAVLGDSITSVATAVNSMLKPQMQAILEGEKTMLEEFRRHSLYVLASLNQLNQQMDKLEKVVSGTASGNAAASGAGTIFISSHAAPVHVSNKVVTAPADTMMKQLVVSVDSDEEMQKRRQDAKKQKKVRKTTAPVRLMRKIIRIRLGRMLNKLKSADEIALGLSAGGISM